MPRLKLKRLYKRQGLKWLAIVFCVAVVLLALPWSGLLSGFVFDSFLGMPEAFALSLFLVPLLIGGLLALHGRLADDTERHMRKFENE